MGEETEEDRNNVINFKIKYEYMNENRIEKER